MKVLVSGASGLIGTELVRSLREQDHQPIRLVRRRDAGEDTAYWDPTAGVVEIDRIEGVEAVVHLAGESVAAGRWTQAKKQRIRESRVSGTELLVHALLKLDPRPKVLLSASAVGFYGDRGDETLDEGSAMGEGFLAEVARDWEIATREAQYHDVRVAHLRFGVVLSRQGGALQKMLLPFRLGLGGRLGDGRQYLSWISIADAVAAILYALDHDDLRGPINLVAPHPVTNAEFTRGLARALARPAVLPLPTFALRLALGDMADEMLLASVRAVPKRLLSSGFTFRHPELGDALRDLFER